LKTRGERSEKIGKFRRWRVVVAWTLIFLGAGCHGESGKGCGGGSEPVDAGAKDSGGVEALPVEKVEPTDDAAVPPEPAACPGPAFTLHFDVAYWGHAYSAYSGAPVTVSEYPTQPAVFLAVFDQVGNIIPNVSLTVEVETGKAFLYRPQQTSWLDDSTFYLRVPFAADPELEGLAALTLVTNRGGAAWAELVVIEDARIKVSSDHPCLAGQSPAMTFKTTPVEAARTEVFVRTFPGVPVSMRGYANHRLPFPVVARALKLGPDAPAEPADDAIVFRLPEGDLEVYGRISISAEEAVASTLTFLGGAGEAFVWLGNGESVWTPLRVEIEGAQSGCTLYAEVAMTPEFYESEDFEKLVPELPIGLVFPPLPGETAGEQQ